jgi:hypothetical protein
MMSEQARAIRRYVDRSYGDAITVTEPIHYPNGKFWVGELKSDYPRRIRDDKGNQSFLKFLTLRDLGEVKLTDDNHIEATPREELIERLHSRLQQWQEKAQQIILSSTAEELAPLGAFKDSINPIVMWVRYLARKKNEITYEQITREPNPKQTQRWIDFLVQIKLLEPSSNGFTYSNLFLSMEKEVLSDPTKVREDFVNHVVAFIMRDYYNMIRQVFRVSRFETYLHMTICYYAPSIQAERMLYRKEESLLKLYHKWYSKTYSDPRLSNVLEELEHQKILKKVDDYWYGSEEIWNRIKPQLQTIPQEITQRKG